MLVVYGGLTGLKETSVGNLFAGAILPGLVLSGLYLAYVAIRCGINPSLGPPIPAEEDTLTAGQKTTMILKSCLLYTSGRRGLRGGTVVLSVVLLAPRRSMNCAADRSEPPACSPDKCPARGAV